MRSCLPAPGPEPGGAIVRKQTVKSNKRPPPSTHGSVEATGRRKNATRGSRAPSRANARPRKPKGWEGAEFMHMQMHMGSMIPFGSEPLSAEDKIESWGKMIAECEHFYPAHLELGIQLLKTERENEGRAHFDRGLADFVRLSEHPEEEVCALVENLERIWRFDLLQSFLERVVERWPEIAWFHDDLAHAAARVGDFATARTSGDKALELKPGAAGFLSNLGLFALLEGRLEDAATHLNRALALDRQLPSARRNRHVLKYLQEHGGRYTDYLLRPAPRAELDKLANAEDWKTLDRKARELNEDRLEAFAQDAVERGKVVMMADQLSTLQILFNFLAELSGDSYFLYDDAEFMRGIFERLMNKFILKFRDADAQVIGEICDALDAFYGFLVRKKALPARDLAAFRKIAGPARKKLIDRATRYAKARSDPKLGADEREALQDELFDGDHVWPHL